MTAPGPAPLHGAGDYFADLIPDLADRAKAFTVEVDVLDDEIMALFSDQIHGMMKSLAVARATRDFAVIRKHAHSLEGSGGTMGFPELSIVGWELNQAARSLDLNRCVQLIERLERWSQTLA